MKHTVDFLDGGGQKGSKYTIESCFKINKQCQSRLSKIECCIFTWLKLLSKLTLNKNIYYFTARKIKLLGNVKNDRYHILPCISRLHA